MKITVGIPVHEACDYALETIEHVKANCNELGADFQIVVIDDFSSERTVQSITSVIKDCGRIIPVSEHTQNASNPNLGLAVNLALDSVREDDDFYLNVESDVYMQPGCLVQLINALNSYQDISAARPVEVDCRGERIENIPPRMDWWHLTCLLIRGEHARNRSIRVEIEPFRLWFADKDYCMNLSKTTRQQAATVYSAHIKHIWNRSSEGRNWPGCLTYEQAERYANDKWARR